MVRVYITKEKRTERAKNRIMLENITGPVMKGVEKTRKKKQKEMNE